MAADEAEPSYIDYEAFLDPSFSPVAFANTLVTATNNASDTPLDLSTPLSRVLFDVQEIDTHIHTLATKAALPLLAYTKTRSEASQRIVRDAEARVAALTEGYRRLEEEVIQRHAVAEEVHMAAARLWQTVKVGRAVGRCLLLGRQLEAQMADFKTAATAGRKEDHGAMVRAASTLTTLRQLFAASGPGEEGEHLHRVHVLTTLESELLAPTEHKLRAKAQQTIREFSMSSIVVPTSASASASASAPAPPPAPATYAQTEDTKARTTSACLALYLLSPAPAPLQSAAAAAAAEYQPTLLLAAQQAYLQTALTSSLASVARALGTLPTLSRTLLEVSARCQNIVALEALLESIKPPSLRPPHPGTFSSSPPSPTATTTTTTTNLPPSVSTPPPNLLQPLLAALDTASLPSFFWRSLASGLSGRVQDIMARGGVSARTLKSQKERVRESIRECVVRGCQGAKGGPGGWEREVGVMVGSVVGGLGR
ncbi:hypothetical protein MMC19_001344 [Ptychographa xylographoides]|nr:hypothetical protein [Ptychographa xylographoides]